jgi:hypothetical protein
VWFWGVVCYISKPLHKLKFSNKNKIDSSSRFFKVKNVSLPWHGNDQ